MAISDNPALDAALARILPRLRDVSVRDGNQSWDGNRWQIKDVLATVTAINDFVATAQQQLGITMAPVETWGGGQVAQPARFLGENPFENLAAMTAIASDIVQQCLWRGRQGLGFKPVSEEIQREAIHAAIAGGVKVFRVFDMMNDLENVETSYRILLDYQKDYPDAGVMIEGAISYISEPAQGQRAWTLDEYAALAVKMADMGADEIVIKNYAGVGGAEMPKLAATIRAALDAARYDDVPLNLHMHGAQDEVFKACWDAGIDTFDVCIGELADGPAHTNMRRLIHGLLANEFNADEIDAHPVMQKLAAVEGVISDVVHRKEIKPGDDHVSSFYEKREFLRGLTPELVEMYRVAGGAFSDLVSRVQKQYEGNKEKQKEAFQDILAEIPSLWEKAGRPNTVTPGAKILIDQAVAIWTCKKYRWAVTMKIYTPEYLDVVTGRYGCNQGMEKNIGDTHFRDAVLLYRALQRVNKAVDDGYIDARQFSILMRDADLGYTSEKKGALRVKVKNGRADLGDPELENVLKLQDRMFSQKELEAALLAIPTMVVEAMKARDDANIHDLYMDAIQAVHTNCTATPQIVSFKSALLRLDIDPVLKEQILGELQIGRSPTPTTNMDDGDAIVADMVRQIARGTDQKTAPSEKIIQAAQKQFGLIAMILRNVDSRGEDDHTIVQKLVGAWYEQHAKPVAGNTLDFNA